MGCTKTCKQCTQCAKKVATLDVPVNRYCEAPTKTPDDRLMDVSALYSSGLGQSLSQDRVIMGWDHKCFSPDEYVPCSVCGRIAGVLKALDSKCTDLSDEDLRPVMEILNTSPQIGNTACKTLANNFRCGDLHDIFLDGNFFPTVLKANIHPCPKSCGVCGSSEKLWNAMQDNVDPDGLLSPGNPSSLISNCNKCYAHSPTAMRPTPFGIICATISSQQFCASKSTQYLAAALCPKDCGHCLRKTSLEDGKIALCAQSADCSLEEQCLSVPADKDLLVTHSDKRLKGRALQISHACAANQAKLLTPREIGFGFPLAPAP